MPSHISDKTIEFIRCIKMKLKQKLFIKCTITNSIIFFEKYKITVNKEIGINPKY